VTEVVRTRDELTQARSRLLAGADEDRPKLGLVPTMGALHVGHSALIEAARSECQVTVVSIFVNPMQFSQESDLARYPRPFDDDLARCEDLGVDLIWAPDVAVMYPGGPAQVWVTAGALANQLEGPSRPGHFDGVLTVVTKLLTTVGPDRAYFGEKDYQQLTLIRRMVADFGADILIRGVPTVRDADGLALSSRNMFLSANGRRAALNLGAALRKARFAASSGGTAAEVLTAAGTVLAGAPDVQVEYLELRDPDLSPTLPAHGPARLLVAATVEGVRLIDNTAVDLAPAESR
jgi:pantoate--beta-alanine ligase